MPYHDIRMPAEIGRADYAVSANIGRTLDAGKSWGERPATQGIALARQHVEKDVPERHSEPDHEGLLAVVREEPVLPRL